MPVGRSEPLLDLAGRQRRESTEEPGPPRARGAVLRDVLVGNPRQPDVVAGPLRHAPLAGTNLVCLTAGPAFLAVVSRHSDSPTASSMKQRRPQVEGQGKFDGALLGRWIDL